MLISVVMPVYNGLPYIQSAIESILKQTVDLELIISDDASQDGTVELLKSLSDPRIKVMTNTENIGIFGNLNRCLSAARGEFIQFFSQDDLMDVGYLASQCDLLRRHRSAYLIYAAPRYIDEFGSVLPSTGADGTPELIDQATYLWISSHFGALPASISSVMIRRDLIEHVGLFNEIYHVAGDLDFYNRVSEKFAIVFNREILHAVRSHDRMTSKQSTTGQRYLREEAALDRWYRSRWSADEYRRIVRFRAAMRGRYHLGWIRRLVSRRQIRQATSALMQLHAVYPLHWVLGWQLLAVARPKFRPRPSIRPPADRWPAL